MLWRKKTHQVNYRIDSIELDPTNGVAIQIGDVMVEVSRDANRVVMRNCRNSTEVVFDQDDVFSLNLAIEVSGLGGINARDH